MALKLAAMNCRRLSSQPISTIAVSRDDHVTLKKRGTVTLIGITGNGRSGNFLTAPAVDSLWRAFDSFEADKTSPAAVLHGEGGTFCKGYHPDDIAADKCLIEYIGKLGLLERYIEKPVVAAVNGYAVGVGFDLALWCDFRIVEETAVLGCYARQYGFPLNKRQAERLVSILGLHKALDLVLTGRIVKPKEAFECGIVNRVVACGTAIGQAINFAYSLVNMPQACLHADRAALYQFSGKFDQERKEAIDQESRSMYDEAVQEFKSGKYVTKLGDVRQKSST